MCDWSFVGESSGKEECCGSAEGWGEKAMQMGDLEDEKTSSSGWRVENDDGSGEPRMETMDMKSRSGYDFFYSSAAASRRRVKLRLG